MPRPNKPTKHRQQDDLAHDKLLDLLHEIEPQLASFSEAYRRLIKSIDWNVSIYGYLKGHQMSNVYLVGLKEKLKVITDMLVDAGNQYMSLVLAGVCPADKMETIEDGLRSLRANHDGAFRYLHA